MADQQTRDALPPDTSEIETLAEAAQPQTTPPVKPARHRKAGTENGSAKRSSIRKRTMSEDGALAAHNLNNGAHEAGNGAHDVAGVNGTNETNEVARTNGANEVAGVNGASSDAHEANGAQKVAAPDNKKTRARKKTVDAAATPAESTAAEEAGGSSRKRGAARKATPAKRRKTGRTVKQEVASPWETVESAAGETATPAISTPVDAKTVQADGAPFEPDLDPTPVQARETPPRSLADIEAELDALLTELALADAVSELEDTLARPALRIAPPAPAPTPVETGIGEAAPEGLEREIEAEAGLSPVETRPESAPERAGGQAVSSVETLQEIPETPMPPAFELAKGPDTPLPAVDEEDALAELSAAVADEEVWDTVVVEEEVTVIAVVEAPPVVEPKEPPLPAVVTPPAVATPPVVVTPPVVITPPPPVRPEARPRRLRLKRVAMLVALLVCLASSLLLWQNASETHLYVYSIDAGSGQMLNRQDLGGYGGSGALSNPAQDATSLFVSVSSSASTSQQVLALAGSDNSWSVTRQFAVAAERSTLSVGAGHVLAVEDGSGLQVLSEDGRVLWQVAGDAPLAGAHAFTPAFDGSTLYTITSARRGMVGAYDARTGTPRWNVQIDDTLNYAPPLLLAGDTLYVAGDSTLYALNTITGGTHWKVAMPARSLLYSQGSPGALIAVGAAGMAAFDPQNGNRLWAFNGRPQANGANGEAADTLTPAQFYQAGLSSDTMIYATGVVWDTRQLQQQLWLFAVDANSGKLAWSEPIGTGFTSADAGRVFAPFVDAAHKLIVIEQAQSDGSHTVSAFDTGDGFQRWTLRLAAVSAYSPALAKTASGNLSVFSAQKDAGLALRSGSRLIVLLLVLAIASFLALLLLWMVPLKGWLSTTRRRLRGLPHTLLATLRAPGRLWRFSRLLFAITLVAVLLGAGLLTYTQLNRQQPYVRQVTGGNGSDMWQHAASSSTTLAGANGSDALVVTGTGDHTFELSALDSHGSTLWRLPVGEGSFFLPDIATQAGTMLAVLRGPATLPYAYAAGDPAYPNPLAHYFALYLLNSQTGAILWRAAPGTMGAAEDFHVVGADAQFIYIAGRSLEQGQVARLLAVDKTDGAMAWRFYGPREQAGSAIDVGAILARGKLVYWQVDSVVYALNPQSGQLEWRTAIEEVNAQAASLEAGQMAAGAGVLLIRRSDAYHALDLATGVERWTLRGLGVDNTRVPGGILGNGNRFILYGGGSIEAVDGTSHSVLWKHLELVAVSNVSLSPDGSTVYAVVFNSVDGGTNTQALVAFDANLGLIRWTFQPGAQAQFVYTGARIIYNASGMIYVATCVASGPGPCTHQVLYGVDEQTGKARWQIQARRIFALQSSPDGQMLTFQIESSAWENLKGIFR